MNMGGVRAVHRCLGWQRGLAGWGFSEEDEYRRQFATGKLRLRAQCRELRVSVSIVFEVL